jgi:hypothetical protein
LQVQLKSTGVLLPFRPVAENSSHLLSRWSLTPAEPGFPPAGEEPINSHVTDLHHMETLPECQPKIKPVTGFWSLDTRCWMLDTGYWMLDARYWSLEINRYRVEG